MQIVVSASGAGPDVLASPVFGHCPTYVFVETEIIFKGKRGLYLPLRAS
jgi:predicted Fe-Mo cluster-binding NifX family protein